MVIRNKRIPNYDLGENVSIDSTASFLGRGKIGDRCYVGAHSIIGHPSSDEILLANKKEKQVIIGKDVIIHPNSIISSGVTIGDGVEIGPFVMVGSDSTIGDRTILIYNAQIHQKVQVGTDCKIGGFLCDCAKVGNNVTVFGNLLHDYVDGWDNEQELKDLEDVSPIIEDNVIVCSGAQVIGKVRLKTRTYVAAAAILTHDTHGECVVKGVNNETCIKIYKGKLKNSKFFSAAKGACQQ